MGLVDARVDTVFGMFVKNRFHCGQFAVETRMQLNRFCAIDYYDTLTIQVTMIP